MKKLIIATIMLSLFMPVMADERSEAEMKAIAAQKLMGAGVKGMGQNGALKMKCVKEDPAFAIYSPEGAQGFVIVSRDDEARPVLGYSMGSFDADNIPCCMEWWLEQTSKQLQAARKVARKKATSTTKFTPVEPFVTTFWNQSWPYNILLPKIDGKNALTGCVATAMAQVLNYNQYPVSAQFMGVYFTEQPDEEWTNAKTLDINSVYKWPYLSAYTEHYADYANHPDLVTLGPVLGNDEYQAIATLMRDCGYAIYTVYGTDNSSADLMDVADALTNYFQYPALSVKKHMRYCYSNDEWMQLIADEMQKKSPIIYGGHDLKQNFGHAFVLHGMDADGLVYVNWGWSGYGAGYYSIDALATDQGSYSDDGHMVTGLRPTAATTDIIQSMFFAEQYQFSWVSTDYYPLKVNIKDCYCFMPNEYKGNIYLAYEDVVSKEVKYEPILSEAFEFEYLWGWEKFQAEMKPALTAGHSYRLFLATLTEGEADYSPVRTNGGAIYYKANVDAAGELTVLNPDAPDYFNDAIESISAAKQVAGANITKVYDAQGHLIQSVPTTSFSQRNIPSRGIFIIEQDGKARKVVR